MGFGYIENASKQIAKLRDRVALLNHLEWIFANYREGRRRRTAVTLGARWPLLCHPFVLCIGKTWPSSNLMSFLSKIKLGLFELIPEISAQYLLWGPSMLHLKSDGITFKTIKFIYPENFGLLGLFLSEIE